MEARVARRRKRNQRSTTLDPSADLGKYVSVSASPSTRSKPKNNKERITKSKSPSTYKPKLADKIKTKKTKSSVALSRRRSNSVATGSLTVNIADDMTESTALSPLSPTEKKSKKKKKKKRPQTSRSDVDYDEFPAFGSTQSNGIAKRTNKRNKAKQSSMTPKVSSTVTIDDQVYSSDDELNASSPDSASAAQHYQDFVIQKKPKIILKNSKTITEGTRALNASSKTVKQTINEGFEVVRKALNEQQSKLLDDVETVYDDKREFITKTEKTLYQHGKKAKNSKGNAIEFDPNIHLTLNTSNVLKKITKYGYVEGFPTGTQGSGKPVSTVNVTEATTAADEDTKEEDAAEMSDEEDGDDAVLTAAAQQKAVLGEIQSNTMQKLDLVILMQREAKKKAKQAATLTREVEEGLKYIADRTAFINEKIAAATPELEKAREAVSSINPQDINEIKTLKQPPKIIQNVMTATALILGHPIKSWRDVQKLLSYKFKPELMNFDTYTLTKETRQKVYKKYAGKEDFNYNRVYEGSKVCGNLVLWVVSQINYSRMLDVIIPLEKEVKKLKKDSKKKEKLAKELLKIVEELEVNIKLYTSQCNEMIAHIIKSTDHELQQFSDKLEPLNQKFEAILSSKVLD